MRKLPIEEFALRFGARASGLAWLVGAGTAAAAGIPTGYDMIADFKARLFAAAAKVPRSQIDVGDPLWRERITSYFDGSHGVPTADDPSEYAVLFERVYPDPADRRAYVDAAVRRGSPSFGHRVLASLTAARLAPCLFTTNFDPLIERAAVVADELLPAAERAHLTVAALDSNERAERCLRESDWPLLVKLHGDYQSEQLKNTAQELASQDERHRRVLVDVAVVHLPDAWAHACRTDTFDAHDELKALGALAAIPTQVVNDRAFTFAYRASRAWRLSIALYVKAGGVPWKLAPLPGVPSTTAYIGLAYALRGNPRDALFVTCCSQVFDADGGGMQFVAYEARDPVDDVEAARRNPYLSRHDMRAVLARSLRVYQARNAGNVPARVAIHKTTGFRPDEVLGATDALEGIGEVDCLEITTDVAWRAVWLDAPRRPDQRSDPGGYPVRRGTMLPVSGVAALLWSAGDTPSISTRGHYYQGGKSIPRPVVLTRYAGSGPLEIPALEVLALTKMDWNNDALYDLVPVTIRYSQLLARTIARVPWLPRNEYPFRLFM